MGLRSALFGSAGIALAVVSACFASPVAPISEARIAYVRGVCCSGLGDRGGDVFVMSASGAASRRVARGAAIAPVTWSPDGRKIAFESGGDIVVVDADGSSRRRLAGGGSPIWSPDGRWIAFTVAYAPPDVYVIRADGSGRRRLTRDPLADFAPSWSPDGRHIAFISARDGDREVFVMDADGKRQRNLTGNATTEELLTSGAWSPDARRIAYVSSRDAGDLDIFVVTLDGRERRLTRSPGRDDYPTWSPDGRKILFIRGYPAAVHVMNADGSGVTSLNALSAANVPPAWSPDGKRIAYASPDFPASEIVVMNADGSGKRYLTRTPRDDLFPVWAPRRG